MTIIMIGQRMNKVKPNDFSSACVTFLINLENFTNNSYNYVVNIST